MRKTTILTTLALWLSMWCMCGQDLRAQDQADIKFESMVHDFGTFAVSDPVQTCEFVFTNVGTAPLVINQAIPSCGCTVPEFSEEPILPGEQGTLKVTYNGKGKHVGPFKKTVTIRSNAKVELLRVTIKGVMVADADLLMPSDSTASE